MTDTISIVGAGHTKFGRLTENLEEMIVAVTREAVEDAGVDPGQIDAVFLGHFNSGLVSDGFASSLIHQAYPELRFKPAMRAENACASGSAAIHAGMNAIQAGKARIVLVVGAEKMTHRATEDVTLALAGAGYQNDENEKKLSFPQVFGVAAREYTDRYGSPLDAMAHISVKNHANAMRNPLAHMQKEFTFEQASQVTNKNPEIAPPLRLTDCSLVTDGAAAIVMTTEDNAASFDRAVRFRSAAHVSDLIPMSRRDFLEFEGPARAFGMALDEAGVTLDDIDFAEVHDCFTIAELLTYEAMGLAPKGQGAKALEEGHVYRGGKLPVNLSGGLKAKGHPVGATGVSMHALSYRQLTGQAGDMQTPGARLGMVFNMGGSAVANYVSILETQKA
ncbi:acetyl-CoA acetyltransferase [Salipiger aestuarii]|uniref:Acetyl-CoA C-acetyltransferase n=1 Tax=Salipiger aestuarii TaxID=568098 RepID=A0A327Y2Y6_9RHOB|nr:acetyl-CoA acetyltransferase [Salipiger aestuarii]EIE49782.1 acetyl-CoA acetyltransferase [Citreicella sp. 357]KAA8607620.1 acetyl-CoA acetyltransferase [Salipiger aestuarii]KAA8611081.1 acetyl-CoA acetyltransferase [Salipiger aestuarii]KAB2541848.1 acetyl-CoA acetyltransferase [Salipiger aestuarii]RAK15363.1 acetyl-CoA C-acetyltransferase [Salipiger aestuarii]